MKINTYKRLFCTIFLLPIFMCNTAFTAEQRILFVCGGNTGRSPTAETLANQFFLFPLAGFDAFSRGVNVNPQETSPEKNAITVVNEWVTPNNLEQHHATPVTVDDINNATLVLAMTEAQKERLLMLNPNTTNKIYLLSECATGEKIDVQDAYKKELSFYRETRDQIADYLYLIQQHHFQCYNN